MSEILNRKVIDKYVSKIKKSEMAFQKDYTSANFVFLILLGIGLMLIFLYYKYRMKLREKRRAEKEEAKRREEEQEMVFVQAQAQATRLADAVLNGPKVLTTPPCQGALQPFAPKVPIRLNPHQVRNMALQPPAEEEKKEKATTKAK